MKMDAYLDEIKMELTGGVLDLELDDTQLQKIVNSSLREIQRYVCSTKIITIPYKKCIDLSEYKVNAVVRVYRANADGVFSESSASYSETDPMQVSLWQFTNSLGNMYNFTDYANRMISYSTMQQIQNTMSTDLNFYYQDDEKKLYVNTTVAEGSNITIEYVPRYDNVDEVKSDFWIDVIMRMSKATAKIVIGRMRKKYIQTNSLWQLDTDILTEGQTEINELREYLQKNTQLIYPMD